MKESILRDKLREFQLFIMENRYSRGLVHDSKNDEDRKKGEAILKDFFIGMVEGKPITKAIEILEYIKEHKWEQTKFKNGDNEERFGVWQYGENFFKWSDLVIDYLVDSLEDMAKKRAVLLWLLKNRASSLNNWEILRIKENLLNTS